MFMFKPVRGKHEHDKTPGQVHVFLLSFQREVKQNFLPFSLQIFKSVASDNRWCPKTPLMDGR